MEKRKNVAVNDLAKRKQPIEVEYNLPTRFNPNKRRFKPQVQEHKRRKKVRLNLVRLRKLPLEVVKHSLDSSEQKDQSTRST